MTNELDPHSEMDVSKSSVPAEEAASQEELEQTGNTSESNHDDDKAVNNRVDNEDDKIEDATATLTEEGTASSSSCFGSHELAVKDEWASSGANRAVEIAPGKPLDEMDLVASKLPRGARSSAASGRPVGKVVSATNNNKEEDLVASKMPRGATAITSTGSRPLGKLSTISTTNAPMTTSSSTATDTVAGRPLGKISIIETNNEPSTTTTEAADNQASEVEVQQSNPFMEEMLNRQITRASMLQQATPSTQRIPATSLRRTQQESQPGAFPSTYSGPFSTDEFNLNNDPRGDDGVDDNASNPFALYETAGLVEARRVSNNPPTIHGSAQPVDLEAAQRQADSGKHNNKETTKLIIIMGLCVVVLAIMGVAIYLAAGRSSDETASPTIVVEPTVDNETLPTYNISASGMILDLPMTLPEETLHTIQQDMHGVTPQHKAYKWVQQDPYLSNYSHDEARLIQRFVAVTFYHSTLGENWEEHGGGLVEITIDTQSSARKFSFSGGVTLINITDTGTLEKVNVTSEPWLSYGTHECAWFNTATEASEPFCNDNGTFWHFEMSKNNLGGSIPEEIGLLSNIKVLKLGWSDIQGTLPTQVGLMTNLEELRIFRSQVRGSIPSELGLLSNKLTGISLIQNQHSGSLPSELLKLSKLEGFSANRNQLTGTLPGDVGVQLPLLDSFRLNDNLFTGGIPSSLGLCTGLDIIDLAINKLTGTIPTELANLVNMAHLELDDNQLTGFVPSELGLLPKLEGLTLEDNPGITGSLPDELIHLNDTLLSLKIKATGLTGKIPTQLCDVDDIVFDCTAKLCGCDCACGEMAR